MALVDGEVVLPLPACEDHKTIGEGDRGPMTGGMGAISPTPVVSDALLAQVTREVLEPTARQLVAMGRPFRGLLYAGLMITSGGPRVLEFNCRFGDPETQPLLLRCRGDLAAALHGVATGQPRPLDFDDGAACCVVLAAAGYPGVVEKGAPIHGLDEAAALEGVVLFHGGTRRQGDGFVTDGGRVLGVTAGGPDLGTARQRAYAAVARIRFDGMQLRRDIGARGMSPGAR